MSTPRPLRHPLLRWTLLLLGLAVILQRGCRHMEDRAYRQAIPEAIALEGLVRMGGTSGLREGCGAAIYRMRNDVSEAIQRLGLAWLGTRPIARARRDYYQYGSWQPTPVDTYLRGLGCLTINEELRREIDKSLTSQGSFYAEGYEYDILIIPSRDLVVFSYMG